MGKRDRCKNPSCNCYPYYGTAPHTHDMSKTGSFIGSTVFTPKDQRPRNFWPDPEDDSCGVYYCPVCLEGMPQSITPPKRRVKGGKGRK